MSLDRNPVARATDLTPKLQADALQDNVDERKDAIRNILGNRNVLIYGPLEQGDGVLQIASTVYAVPTQSPNSEVHDDNQLLENPTLANDYSDLDCLRQLILTREGQRNLYRTTTARNITAVDRFVSWFRERHQPKVPIRSPLSLWQRIRSNAAWPELTQREWILVGACTAASVAGIVVGTYIGRAETLKRVNQLVEESRENYHTALALSLAQSREYEELLGDLRSFKYTLSHVYDGSVEAAKMAAHISVEGAKLVGSACSQWISSSGTK